MATSLTSRRFGLLPTGETVEAWTLTGCGGLTLEVMTFGGIVTRLLVPDIEGCLTDVVLGFPNLEPYLLGHPYFGAIIGRAAGRIVSGRFRLDGRGYQLALNEPPNHLHGGFHGFDKKCWIARAVKHPTGAPSLKLTYRSPDGEEGYPGNVDVAVTYTVTHTNVVLIETEAATDQSTPFNLTHHSYFNLGGDFEDSILDHELVVEADEVAPTDERLALLGRLEPVTMGGNDFRVKRSLRSAIPHLLQNHGDLYRIRRPAHESVGLSPVLAARLEYPLGRRAMEVRTTEEYLQLYTGSALDGSLTGKANRPYFRHAGVCLECHGYPDGANCPSLGDIVLRPQRPLRQTTSYAFSLMAISETFSG